MFDHLQKMLSCVKLHTATVAASALGAAVVVGRRMRRRLLEEEVDRTAHVARRRLQRDGRLLLREAHRDERRDGAIQHDTRFFRFVGFGLFPTAVSRQHHRCRRSLRVRDASTREAGRTLLGVLGVDYVRFPKPTRRVLAQSPRVVQT